MNCYAGLDDLRRVGKLGAGWASADDQAGALYVLEVVSRSIEKHLARRFYDETATAYFDGNGMRRLILRTAANEQGRGDLVSVTSVKMDENHDGVYELTLTQNTDYRLTNRDHGGAYRVLEALPELSTRIGYWPAWSHCIEVVGVWGYSAEYESAGTLGAAIADTTTPTVTMNSGHTVQAGNTIKVGSEQLFVSAVNANELTVERGVNGTTAAAALDDAAVTRRRYPVDIEMVAAMEAARLVRDAGTGYSGQVANSEFAGYAFSAMYPAMQDLKRPFHPTGGAVVA